MHLKTTLPDGTTIVLRTPTEGDIPHLHGEHALDAWMFSLIPADFLEG